MANRSRSKAKAGKRKVNRLPEVDPLKKDSIPRAVLGKELQKLIKRYGMTREQAGRIVDDAASQMSRLMTGHISEFSADRLVKMLIRLGSDVTITIKHSRQPGNKGRVRVVAR